MMTAFAASEFLRLQSMVILLDWFSRSDQEFQILRVQFALIRMIHRVHL